MITMSKPWENIQTTQRQMLKIQKKGKWEWRWNTARKRGDEEAKRIEMSIYRHCECRIKSSEWIEQLGRQGKEREITKHVLSDWGNDGAHFFLQRQAGSLAQQMTTLDWKEAFNSSPRPLPWTSYLTWQAPFLQLCKMGGLRENESNVGPVYTCQGNPK